MNLSLLAAEGNNGLIQQELAIIILISIAAAVAIAVRYIRFPYTVALVLVGLVLSFFPALVEIDISKELILALLVPPLLFEAALHIQWKALRKNLLPVLLIALLGTLIGTFIVGGVVTSVLGMPFTAAIVFGALISATDPVAVISFFRTLGVDKRLTILVEGESLFNDGIAIVVFNIALATGVALRDGVFESFSILGALQEFAIVSGGGLVIGSLLGGIVSYVILKNVDDALIETTVTLAVAFGSFLTAEYFGSIFGGLFSFIGPNFHFSGILAVVAASLFVGNIGSINTSPTTRVTLDNFWQFLTFIVNSLVFLIIGLRIELAQFLEHIMATIVAVLVVLLSRAIVIYLLGWVHSIIQPKNAIKMPYRHIMFWGGLRGAISIALALTLTGDIFGAEIAEQIQVMTFGVVLFTLLVQGLSIESIIKRLGLVKRVPERDERLRLEALVYAKRAGQRELEQLYSEGLVANEVYEAMNAVYASEIHHQQNLLIDHLRLFPELEQEMLMVARTDTLRAERVAIMDAARRGLVPQEMQAELISEIDERSEAVKVLQQVS